MGSLVERFRNAISKRTTAISQSGSENHGNQDSEGSRYREWSSPDGKRKIIYTVCSGPRYEGRVMEDVHLLVIGGTGTAEMMRVQVTQNPDSEPEYNVYLDAIQERDGFWVLAGIDYFQSNDGIRKEVSGWSRFIRGHKYPYLSEEEFKQLAIAELKREGVFDISEIPEEIDTKATVEAFMAKVLNGDFSRPELISKQKQLEDPKLLDQRV